MLGNGVHLVWGGGGSILLDNVNGALAPWKIVSFSKHKGADFLCTWSAHHTWSMVEYGSSSHWHYEMTPIRNAEAYASPWLDVRTQTHLSEISEQKAVEPPRGRWWKQEKCLFFHCLRDTFLMVFLCCIALVANCSSCLFVIVRGSKIFVESFYLFSIARKRKPQL
jgi:hypothetical protein